jgi:hypothetical protein
MVQGRQATPHDGTSTAGLPGSSFLFLHNVPLRAYRRRLTALALNHYGTGLVQDKQKPRQIRQTRMGYVVIKLIQAVEKRLSAAFPGRLTISAAWQEVALYSSRRHPSSILGRLLLIFSLF